jgi:AraC-like DNA-binding protein
LADFLKLYIKNMVCMRCKMVVKNELIKLGIHYSVVDLGEVDIPDQLSDWQYDQVKSALLKSGLELLDDKKSVLIHRIKTAIIELVHHSMDPLRTNLSEYLSTKLNHNYTYLADFFSEIQGITIEKFYISHKIERAKELLVYDELTLSEIARKLHYKNVTHLSTQFKKVTGLTPTHFKQLGNKKRIMLEDL